MTSIFAFLRRRPMILREIDARAHELRTDTKMATQTRARMLRTQKTIMTAILAAGVTRKGA